MIQVICFQYHIIINCDEIRSARDDELHRFRCSVGDAPGLFRRQQEASIDREDRRCAGVFTSVGFSRRRIQRAELKVRHPRQRRWNRPRSRMLEGPDRRDSVCLPLGQTQIRERRQIPEPASLPVQRCVAEECVLGQPTPLGPGRAPRSVRP